MRRSRGSKPSALTVHVSNRPTCSTIDANGVLRISARRCAARYVIVIRIRIAAPVFPYKSTGQTTSRYRCRYVAIAYRVILAAPCDTADPVSVIHTVYSNVAFHTATRYRCAVSGNPNDTA